MDYGSLLCWGHSSLGLQLTPCVFTILPAGIYYSWYIYLNSFRSLYKCWHRLFLNKNCFVEGCTIKCSRDLLELNVLHFIFPGNLLETFQVFHFLIVHLKWSKHCNFKSAFCGLVCILLFVAILRDILFCLKL